MIAMTLALAGCANIASTSYELGSGDANYDALNRATKECETAGGHVSLKGGGYDARQLDSYVCVGAKR